MLLRAIQIMRDIILYYNIVIIIQKDNQIHNYHGYKGAFKNVLFFNYWGHPTLDPVA